MKLRHLLGYSILGAIVLSLCVLPIPRAEARATRTFTATVCDKYWVRGDGGHFNLSKYRSVTSFEAGLVSFRGARKYTLNGRSVGAGALYAGLKKRSEYRFTANVQYTGRVATWGQIVSATWVRDLSCDC